MYFKHNGIYSTKIIIASQARFVNQYKNLRQNKNTKHFSSSHIH